ncbi:pimeloyl-ACP methyl esterase BioG family protein [Phaeobacter porticola]|uniref:Biotin synthesis protein BioC n=1 Tax=Phaeobacter porticola TaxID=1844006 RepID=A0A1L3I2I3_9RHOB|nr:pimeloyl-ACP methyl esterase BioG family protein [Phaeobacter porticola]APG46312.1 putative protein in bacteria [Phaeobacter porticola]
MEFRWLKQTQSAEAIVVFGGWAVGPEVFGHLNCAQDILFADDYRDLNADLPDLTTYGQITLLAWSFGVASYAHWQAGRVDPFVRKVAINGTLCPVDSDHGIPPQVVANTISTLSKASYQQFLRRVFSAPQVEAAIDVPARRKELEVVADRGAAPHIRFDHVWISARDRIFPPAHQYRAWKGQSVHELDGPHAPFARFSNWHEVIG